MRKIHCFKENGEKNDGFPVPMLVVTKSPGQFHSNSSSAKKSLPRTRLAWGDAAHGLQTLKSFLCSLMPQKIGT
jgi:hypothetical protein